MATSTRGGTMFAMPSLGWSGRVFAAGSEPVVLEAQPGKAMLLEAGELLGGPGEFRYFDVEGREQRIDLSRDGLAFTVCQVPVVYRLADAAAITVHGADCCTATRCASPRCSRSRESARPSCS